MRHKSFLILAICLTTGFGLSSQTITSFSPANATAGVTVTITGTDFQGSPAVSSVSFGGVPASSFTVINQTTIVAIVSGGGATGSVTVVKGSSSVSRPGFTFFPATSSTSWPFSYLLKPSCSNPNTMPPNAGSCTKWPEKNNGEWNDPSTWNNNSLPTNMDIVCIPANTRVIIKNPVYEGTSVCPASNPALTPRLFIFVCGTLDFDASGKLFLGCQSAIQVLAGGKVLSANGNSELIQVGTKVVWRDNNTDLAGPYYLNDGCLTNGCVGQGVLPTHLGSLKAAQNGPYKVGLSWSTSYEYQSSKFIVERSLDMSKWEILGEVRSLGNSQRELQYHFTDLRANQGVNFYRLRQVDFNGSESFSDIAKINTKGIASDFAIYPNPANDKITIYSKGGFNQGSQLQLYHKNGLLLEIRNIQSANAQTLDVSNFSNGVYFLRIVDSKGTTLHTQSVIKN